jgi:hypothetical protein
VEALEGPVGDHPDDDAKWHAVRLAGPEFTPEPKEHALRGLVTRLSRPKAEETAISYRREVAGEEELVVSRLK